MTGYTITKETYNEIQNRFTYHQPKGDQAERYIKIRGAFGVLATMLHDLCPPSRELSLAITKLEEASFWANASIARNETEPPTGGVGASG